MSIEYGDRLIVHFFENQEGKFNGDAWPHHVTLLPWFNVPDGRHNELADELRIIARRWGPVKVDVEGEDMFGPKNTIPVTRLGANALRAFHYNLLNTIERVGGTVRDMSFAGTKYQPHVSHGYDETLFDGLNQTTIADFTLVEKIDNRPNNREVIASYKLEGIK